MESNLVFGEFKETSHRSPHFITVRRSHSSSPLKFTSHFNLIKNIIKSSQGRKKEVLSAEMENLLRMLLGRSLMNVGPK